jgi:hypothetical protein
MERYIDELDVPPRYEGIVEEYKNGDLGNFVGSYCGHPVFSVGHEVLHPTTREVVGYSNNIQIGRKRSMDPEPHDNMFGTVYGSRNYMTIDKLLRRGDELLEKGRRRSIPLDMGWTGIKAAVASGAVGSLMGLFDITTPTSVAIATAASAIGGGLSSLYRRHRDRRLFEKYMRGVSCELSKMEKVDFSVNLLAPDSCIDEDAQTGSLDNRQSSNVYYIGGVPVDQQQRFNSFWDQADEVLEEYGFTEWQGYRTVGIPELVRRILEDVHNNCDLDNDHKEIIVSKIRHFGHSRSSAIKGIEGIQEKLDGRNLRIKHGLEKRGLTDPDELVTDQIEQTDRKCIEAFCDFIAGIKEVFTEAKKESVQELLVRIYGGKSSLQGYFWGELSQALAINSIDPYDEAVAEPAQFITDIPGMMPSGGESPSKSVVYELYEAFYRNYSGRYDGMLPPEEFIDKLSED